MRTCPAAQVTYPLELDLYDFCSDQLKAALEGPRAAAKDAEDAAVERSKRVKLDKVRVRVWWWLVGLWWGWCCCGGTGAGLWSVGCVLVGAGAACACAALHGVLLLPQDIAALWRIHAAGARSTRALPCKGVSS
jgi:hypothetical protein